MSLRSLEIPAGLQQISLSTEAGDLIDRANEAIEEFLLAEETTIENFVTSDYHLLEQTLTWVEQNHLLAGDRFCEWGAGFGVGAMLAALHGMKSVGIEIESRLALAGHQLAGQLGSSAEIYCGSFVPRDVDGIDDYIGEVYNVEIEEDDVYQEIGLEIEDFDLIFAFPWPGEHEFFEHVFDARAAEGALLLTYRGREGMHLLRKI